MPVNLYEKPVSGEYFVMPFHDLANVGLQKQRAFDKDKDELDKLKGLIQINADPKQEAYRNELLKHYNNKITDVTNRYLQTGDRNVLREANILRNEYQNDAERLTLEASYADWKKYQPDAQDAMQKQLYDPIYDPYAQFNPDGTKAQRFNYAGMKTITDYYKPAKEMMADVAKSGSENGWYEIDSTGAIIGKKKGWEAVAREDINRVADAKVDLFLQHKDSAYLRDKFFATNKDAGVEDLRAYARDYLRREGENQIFRKSSSDANFKYPPEYIAAGKDEQLADPTQISSRIGNQQVNMTDLALDNEIAGAKFDDKGNAVYTTTAPASVTNAAPGLIASPASDAYSRNYSNSGTNAAPVSVSGQGLHPTFSKLRENNPIYKDMTDAQIQQHWLAARQNPESVNQGSYRAPNIDGTKVIKSTLNNINGVGFLVQGQETTGFKGVDVVKEYLGYSNADEFKEAYKQATATGHYSPANQGAYEINIKDANGLPRTIYVLDKDEQVGHFAPATKLAKLQASGQTGEHQLSDNTYAKIVMTNDAAGQPLQSTIVYNTVPASETKDFIKSSKKTREQLEQEGYLFTKDGKLILQSTGKTPEMFNKEITKEWANSPYERTNRATLNKNSATTTVDGESE